MRSLLEKNVSELYGEAISRLRAKLLFILNPYCSSIHISCEILSLMVVAKKKVSQQTMK